ncbi:unnamed protein product [Paramecium sonneborni]|uniref:Uncharacterized protein n=1 Tax=Paramecium sonneborni TaxID=65129 RepID=A0A8S1K5I7_9CILI|nr:unnamed protein product [Paramecium sonneborni]
MNNKNIQTSLDLKQSNFAFCLSNDEKQLIIIQQDRLVAYDLSKGQFNIITLFEEIQLNQTKICISSDNLFCCVSTQLLINGQLIFVLLKFDLQKKVLSNKYLNYHLMSLDMLEFIPNSHILISLSIDATIKIFDLADQKPKTLITRCSQKPLYCRLIHKKNRVVIFDNLFNIKLMDTLNEKQLKLIKLRLGRCYKALAEENGIVAFLAKSDKCYLYDLPKQKLIRKYKSPDNFNLFKVHTNYLLFQEHNQIMILNTITCKQQFLYLQNIQYIYSMMFNQNLDKLFLCDQEQIHIFDNIEFLEQ